MELREHADAREFLEAGAPVLEADEARHNLAFGICATLLESPETYPTFRLWTVENDGEVVGAALRTPPYYLWFGRPLADGVAEFLAAELKRRDIEIPGVTAAVPEVDDVASAWEREAGVRRELHIAQGVYRVSAPVVPDGVPGQMREATDADRGVLVDWWQAFAEEALPDGEPRQASEEQVDRRLAGRAGGVVVWEDEGALVSFAGFGGRTPNGIRIGPVYTPPELRRRGYASALTAHLSKREIDGGLSYCFLYTDMANPTSNRIYQNIGYELVCESAAYAFHPE